MGSDFVAAKIVLKWRFYFNVETLKSMQWGVLWKKSDQERRQAQRTGGRALARE